MKKAFTREQCKEMSAYQGAIKTLLCFKLLSFCIASKKTDDSVLFVIQPGYPLSDSTAFR